MIFREIRKTHRKRRIPEDLYQKSAILPDLFSFFAVNNNG
jgi:hypothetical protein